MDEITKHTVKLAAALLFAVNKHDEALQTRVDRVTPYWVHPFRVAERLRAVGINDYEILSAAFLHDVIEDTNTSLEYVHGAEDTLAACSNGNPQLQQLLRHEIEEAKRQFTNVQ